MDKEDLKYIEQGLLVCGINDDLGEKLLNEKFANNIDKDILNIIKDPKSETNFSKCSKSAAIRLVIAYNNPKYKDIKLCLGYFSPKGDEGVNNINHAWVEIDGKTYESNVPSGDYKKVLVDELTIDRNEDLYNQVEEFLNKSNLREYVVSENVFPKDLNEDLSQEVDSEGNPLTPEQVEFFKNSKVRDDKGRLLVVYHGTKRGGFNSFNLHDIYFSDNERVARTYTNTYKELNSEVDTYIDNGDINTRVKVQGLNSIYVCYLLLINPLIVDFNNKHSTNCSIKLDNNIYTNIDDICKYAHTQNYDGVIAKNIIDDEMEVGILGDDYIAFNPNQIKSIDNKNPSSSNNINEDLDKEKEVVQSLINVYGESDKFEKGSSFILPNGKFINLGSDSHMSVDNIISWKLYDCDAGEDNWQIGDFMNKSNSIRVGDGSYINSNLGYISFSHNITSQQWKALNDFIFYCYSHKLKGVDVELSNYGEYLFKDYENPDDIIKEIKRKYNSTNLNSNLQKNLSLTKNVQRLIDKLKDYNIELVGGKELHNDYSLTLKNKDNNATRKIKVAKNVKPTKSYCDYLKDYLNNLQEDLPQEKNNDVDTIKDLYKQSYNELIDNSTRLYRYREWANNSNSDYKEYIYNDLKSNKKDSALKLWYNHYRLMSGKYDLSYDDFLNTPITLYRATNNNEEEDNNNPFFSYAQNKRDAERFLSAIQNSYANRTGEIVEIQIKPKDTFGMLPSDENEVIVPNKSYVNKVDNIDSVVNELVDYANSKGVKLPYDRDELVDMFKKDRNIDKFKKLIIDYIDKRTIKETINEEVLYHGQDDDDMYDRENTLTWYTTSEKYAKEYGQKIFTKDIDLSKYNLLDIGDINDEVFDNDGKYTKEFKQFCKKIEMTPKQLENYLKQFGWYPKYLNFIFDITSEYPFYRLLLDLGYDGVKAKESGYDTYGLIKSDLNEGTSGQSIKQSNLNQKTKRNIIKIAKDNNFDFALDIKELSVHHLNDEKDDNGLKNNDYSNLVFIKSKDFRDREVLHKLLHYMDRNDISYDDLLNQLETIKLYKYDEPTNKFIVKTLSNIKESLLQETQKLYNIKEYYHGTPSKELNEEINSTLWFTDDIIYAMRYGENIFTCDLSVNNPLNVGDTNKYIRGLMPNTFSQEFIDIAKALNVEPKKLLHIDEDARKIYTIVRTKEFKDLCIKNGYDAIQTIEDGSMCYGIFDLNQIKVNDIDLG